MSTPQDEMRAKFEAYADDQGYPLHRLDIGDCDDYRDLRTQGAFDSWQAATAAQAEALAVAQADAAAALGLLSKVRFALGDNGTRMQDELIEWCKGLRDDAARLDALAQPGWELSMNNDSEAMDDELWQVHRVSGGRNDREWRLIGQGCSPRAAIDSARATLTPTAQGAQEQA